MDPRTILYSSFKDPKKGFSGYCASAPPDWTGEKSQSWPGRLPKLSAPFRDGILRAERLGDHRGRGLIAGVDIARGSSICGSQLPLALHQYQESRQLCKVCAHCHRFVGSLRDAICQPLTAAGVDTPEGLLDDPQLLEELDGDEWRLKPCIACERDCGAVFCSEECKSFANTEGWHRILCTDLPTDRRPVWRKFRAHADKYHEAFTLATQVIAEIICLVQHHGADLWEAMAYFTRFAKMSWVDMGNVPSRSNCEVAPTSGELERMARLKYEKRLVILTDSLELLCAMLWEREFNELLTIEFYGNLVGQFSLSNVWVQVEHPLSDRLRRRAFEDQVFRDRFRKLAAASSRAARAITNGEKHWRLTQEGAVDGIEDAEDKTPDKSKSEDDDIWSLPVFEATGLYSCMALSNHSCVPNYTMDYAEGGFANLRALRDIKMGEELTLAYVSPSFDLDERLQSLWRTWGFVCTCCRCQDQLMARVLEKKQLPTSLRSNGTESGGYRAQAEQIATKSAAAASAPANGATNRIEVSSSGSSGGSGSDDEDDVSDDEDDEDDDSDSENVVRSKLFAATRGAAASTATRFPATARPPTRGPPTSVLRLEEDLKELMELMGEDD